MLVLIAQVTTNSAASTSINTGLIESVPIQTVVVICTAFLSALIVLLIFILTDFKKSLTDLTTKLNTVETKMNTIDDTKADKTSVEKSIELKADKSLIELQLAQLIQGNTTINGKIDSVVAKLDTAVTDLAFLKGKEEARREYASK